MNIIVYHQIKPGLDCPDGICAAWVASRNLNDFQLIGDSYLNNDDYKNSDYQLPFDPTGNVVIIVDFSYPKNILEQITDKAEQLIVLDHHKTRMNNLASLSDRILGGYSADDCGATFAWKYFHPREPMPWFLPHVKNRDTGSNGYYEGETPESEAITTAISLRRKGLVGKEAFKVYEDLLDLTPEQVITEEIKQDLIERDRLAKEALSQYNGALLQVGDYLVPYYHLVNTNAHRHYSVIGSKAAQRHQEAPFIAIVTDDPLRVSLRARANAPVDLSILAESLGGGGHERAAGYTVKIK